MVKSAYIHIPFCRQKCKYCSFVSFTKQELTEEYIKSLLTEIKTRYKGEKLKTLYFGGGTPSILNADNFEKIITLFNFEENPEITAEVNPEFLTYGYLKSLYESGVNRISTGIQSFDDKILSEIGRKHTSEEAVKAVEIAKKAGFKNISTDLIYGLPEQTPEKFLKSLKMVVSLDIQHISSYGLKIDEGSYYYNHLPKNLPDSDVQADMYEEMVCFLENNGFNHYEISNFAKKGFESKHNLNYWNAEEYYGFGCASCGYEDKTRYSHTKNPEEYIKNPINLTDKEILTEQNLLEEHIFLGLRKKQGIDISEINKKFGIDFYSKYGFILQKYENYFEKKENFLNFNLNGFLISNIILSEFIEA